MHAPSMGWLVHAPCAHGPPQSSLAPCTHRRIMRSSLRLSSPCGHQVAVAPSQIAQQEKGLEHACLGMGPLQPCLLCAAGASTLNWLHEDKLTGGISAWAPFLTSSKAVR